MTKGTFSVISKCDLKLFAVHLSIEILYQKCVKYALKALYPTSIIFKALLLMNFISSSQPVGFATAAEAKEMGNEHYKKKEYPEVCRNIELRYFFPFLSCPFLS